MSMRCRLIALVVATALGSRLALAAAPDEGEDLTALLRTSPDLSSVLGKMGANICEEATPLNLGTVGSSAYVLSRNATLEVVGRILAGFGVDSALAAEVSELVADALKAGGKAAAFVAAFGAFYLFMFTVPEEREAGCKAQLGSIVGYDLDAASEPPTGRTTDKVTFGADDLAAKLKRWARSARP